MGPARSHREVPEPGCASTTRAQKSPLNRGGAVRQGAGEVDAPAPAPTVPQPVGEASVHTLVWLHCAAPSVSRLAAALGCTTVSRSSQPGLRRSAHPVRCAFLPAPQASLSEAGKKAIIPSRILPVRGSRGLAFTSSPQGEVGSLGLVKFRLFMA